MKKIIQVVFIVFIILTICTDIFAVRDPGYDENLVNGNIKKETGKMWATISVIVQIASVACVVFAGLRYMFSAADQKADIKQGLINLTIGAILVFGATSIIRLVSNGANSVIK